MEKADIVVRMKEVLSSFPVVQTAYLYGSFLNRNDFRDIDIAVLFEEDLLHESRISDAGDIGLSLEETLGFAHGIDIRILNDAPVWFQFEVISTGQPLYARSDERRFDFETNVTIAYLDMKYTLDLFDREYLAKV